MEVAKEVFEIKRRSTLHSVVQRSFPLYAPDTNYIYPTAGADDSHWVARKADDSHRVARKACTAWALSASPSVHGRGWVALMHTTGAFNDICNNYLHLKQQKQRTKTPIHLLYIHLLLHKTGQGSHVVVSGSLYAVVGQRQGRRTLGPPGNHYLHTVQSSNSPPFSTLLLAISFAQVGQVLSCSENS